VKAQVIGVRRHRGGRLAVLVILSALVLLTIHENAVGPSLVSAATIVVDTEADSDAADGNCSLREAIMNANADAGVSFDCENGTGADTITFANGLETIVLTSNLSVLTDADVTTIDGGGDIIIDGDGNFRPITVGTVANVILRSIRITNGSAANGGGVNNGGHLEIYDSTIVDNQAELGGGIFSWPNSDTLIIHNTTISENNALQGAGIYARDDEVEIVESFILDNVADGAGGGIYLHTSQGTPTLEVSRTSISGNRATTGSGGGIHNDGGHVEVIDSTISGNDAGIIGGGISTNGQSSPATLIVLRSTIDDNEATQGGGIYIREDNVTITNSTISGNRAVSEGAAGGGIYNAFVPDNGTVITLINTTVAFNSSSQLSANSGIHNAGAAGEVVIHNTIVAENSPVDCSGPVTSQGNNLDSDDSCSLNAGGDISNGDADLGPLDDNGGPTETHALLSGSDAIDTGNNAACADDPVDNEDQRGEDRPEDGDGNGSAICDIGAYEAPGIAPTPVPTGTPRAVATQPSGGLGSALAGLFAQGQLQATATATAPQTTAIRPPSTGDGGLR